MNYSKPHIINDIHSPCNKNKCTFETIASCCGCPEWFAWKTGVDQRKIENEYVGKHLKKEDNVDERL